MGYKTIDKKIAEIQSKFPYKYSSDCTIYLNDIIVLQENNNNKFMIDIADNYGYKYYFEYCHLNSAKGNGYELNRFFKRNKYTKDNINNFLKLNEINYILQDDIECSGIARKKLCFVHTNGGFINASWNDIQRNTERYRDDYTEIKEKKKESRSISKDEAIQIIYKMQSELDRPIDSKDFRKKKDGYIGIRTILKYWSTIAEMQTELGLHITQYPSKIDHSEYKDDVLKICQKTKLYEGRTTITYNDIKKYGVCSDPKIYNGHCKKDGITLKELISSFGYELQNAGNGLNYIFEDGERITSLYEYNFSVFLRSKGFKFNIDYFRDVKYRDIDKQYNGNMNCDYLLKICNHNIYIELAGLLGNKEHQIGFINNTPLKSKSKEHYRLSLNKKKEMFERNHVEYYILLKDDMNEFTYNNILNKFNLVA